MPEVLWFLGGCFCTLVLVFLFLQQRSRNGRQQAKRTAGEPARERERWERDRPARKSPAAGTAEPSPRERAVVVAPRPAGPRVEPKKLRQHTLRSEPRHYVLTDNRNLETLTRGIGQELASLCTSVDGHAQGVCESLDDPIRARSGAVRLWDSVRRLRLVSEKLQSFARVAPLETQPTAVRAVLQGLVHEVEDYAGATLQVALTTAPSLPMALANHDALRLAMMFLIEAVLTLEPDTPTLTISAQTELDEDMDAEVLVEIEAESEDGSEPDPTGASDIRFSYVAARNLLEAQGAWVSLMHRPGLSVVASVSLKATTTPAIGPELPLTWNEIAAVATDTEAPTALGAGPLSAPPTPVPPPHAFGGVLVLERNPGIREMVTRELESYQRNVIACDDGKAALTLYEATPERFELLILEQDARRLSGEDLATRALAERSDLSVILVAPTHGFQRSHPLASENRCLCISKPFGLQELRSALRALLGMPAGGSPQPAGQPTRS